MCRSGADGPERVHGHAWPRGGPRCPPPQYKLDLDGLVGQIPDTELLELLLVLTGPASEAQEMLAGLLQHPLAVQQALEALRGAASMPPDAAERWGSPAAAHSCSKRDGNCLAVLAQADGGARLDTLRRRLNNANVETRLVLLGLGGLASPSQIRVLPRRIAGEDEEMSKLERFQAYEEVPEDSLSTWDRVKRRAREVIDTLWVLKRKHGADGTVLEWKARCVINGHQALQGPPLKGEDHHRGGLSVCYMGDGWHVGSRADVLAADYERQHGAASI